ncbi:MAG: hypothetical protein FJW31_24025 [Acidobacteria bacterium]|nr:hypothetical protein [Acidobacteriota bacterium]
MLREAVAAVKKGDRAIARTLLRDIIHEDPRNSQAWLWLAGVADSVAEVTHCLEEVLEVDPSNQMATERLSMLRLLRYTSGNGTASDVGTPARPAPLPPRAPDAQAIAVRGPAGEVTVLATRPPAPVVTLPPKPKARNNVLTVCPLCQSDIDLRKQQCTRCGIVTSLRHLAAVAAGNLCQPQRGCQADSRRHQALEAGARKEADTGKRHGPDARQSESARISNRTRLLLAIM